MSEPVVYEPDYSGRSAGAAARLALHLEPRRDYRTQYFFRFLSFLTVKNAPDSCNCGRTRRKSMTKTRLLPSLTLMSGLASIGILLATTSNVGARDKPKRETIQATAMGRQRASGKTFHVTVNIDSYSTPEDQKVLSDAFSTGGHNALVKTLSKMQSKGRVAITGTLGYQIAYIRSVPTGNGRRIRLITDRPIHFNEAYVNGRSKDYDLSALEITLNTNPKQSEGALIVAGRFGIDKNKQISFESYGSGPWRLVNIMEWN